MRWGGLGRMVGIPISSVPYLRFFRRLLAGAGELGSVAAQQDIVWPEETVRARPAICLSGQIDRIVDRASNSPSPNEKEIAQVSSMTLTRGATIAYHIKDAILSRDVSTQKTLSTWSQINRSSNQRSKDWSK